MSEVESSVVHSGGGDNNTTVAKTKTFNIADLGLSDGKYEINATISAEGYVDSGKSNYVILTVSEGIVTKNHGGGTN